MRKITLIIEDEIGRTATLTTHGTIRGPEFKLQEIKSTEHTDIFIAEKMIRSNPTTWHLSLRATLVPDEETGLNFTVEGADAQ